MKYAINCIPNKYKIKCIRLITCKCKMSHREDSSMIITKICSLNMNKLTINIIKDNMEFNNHKMFMHKII